MSNQTADQTRRMPEFFRKIIVALKRRPQTIPLIALLAAFLLYSLNLTHVSHTTSRIQGPGMGLYGFITMLLSMLSFVCFFNAFPRRKKPNVPMLVLMFVMFAIIIFADVQYRGLIHTALTRAENPIAEEIYITKAFNMLYRHIITLLVSCGLIVLMPVYSKWLRKINTSIGVEDYGKLSEIDISGED
jgi:glucan phosphoethanolaminetransferase (alkaline phosphatase superfamily)